ncbi:hypothetical protein ACFOU2_11845 [Bacillus songklensis]|uniref:Uncharacterized protein n=1 Tax=Bacillus songklensis TaxID=1069116 RepID=A0ABV8B4E5_9BACI
MQYNQWFNPHMGMANPPIYQNLYTARAVYPSFYGQPNGYVQQAYDGFEYYDEETMRTPEDVNRVMRVLNQQYGTIYTEIQRGGMDRKLADYLFRSTVTFADENYNNYTGNIDQKIEQASRQLQRREPWIFDIMRIYSVSPASQIRIVNTVLRASFENLRPAPLPPR